MEALLRTLAILLERGAILCWDYGFAAAEYYHPQRARGTLMCHFQNRAHDNPFFAIGAQDITAHIDFSAAAEAAADGGAQLLGYASQANFLINCGILKMLEEESAPTAAAQAKLNAGVHKLLAPHEMGELFKVIAFGKNYNAPLIGFSQGGREHRL
jgi:SAM-dependent MidA family methyltransferase